MLDRQNLNDTLRYRPSDQSGYAVDDFAARHFSLEDLIHYVGWSDDDHQLLLEIAEDVEKEVDVILDSFYFHVIDNAIAFKILNDANTTVDSLKQSLKIWLIDAVKRPIDDEAHKRQQRVGIRHVEVHLPQSFMVMGINVLRNYVVKVIKLKYSDDTDKAVSTIEALNKNFDIRLAIMLRSYQDDRDRLLKENVLSENESILAMGRMSASIAHEIKNPLAGISGAIQVLKDKTDQDSADAPIMDAVLDQVKRLSGTVKDLLDFARPLQLNKQDIALSDIVDSLSSVMESDPSFLMNIHYADDATKNYVIYADPVRLQGVFFNLFANANEALEGEGEIVLSHAENSKWIEIFIKDNGPGIPDGWAEELFKPFATNKTHGTGLGLAVCSKIMEAHGGSIQSLSQDKGACFSLKLPKRIK